MDGEGEEKGKGNREGSLRHGFFFWGGRPEISPPLSFIKVGAYALSAFLSPFPLHSLFAFPGSCF